MSVVKNNITIERQVKYAVIRNGSRVSDLEYTNKEEAKTDYDQWNNIVKRGPDGSKLEIVESKGK